MASQLSGFVQGLFVEVFWDIERCNSEGRREGDRKVESVWWRGEVIEVRKDRGLTLAKVKYDANGEFDVQLGEVSVFPLHMQALGEQEMTQLRWRYSESSGDVTYSSVDGDCDGVSGATRICGTGEEEQSVRVFALQQKFDELACQFEKLQRLVASQGDMFSRLSGAESRADRCCERVFGLLRHKLATSVQKPIHTYRHRNENHEASNLFDLSCAGSIRVDVNCSVDEFQNLCRVVKMRCERSRLFVDGRPFAPFSGSLQASVGIAEILFDSLSGLCAAIGICQETDIMNIAKRERLSGKRNRTEDAAIRVVGSFLIDSEAHGTPTAILVCRGVHEGLEPNEQIDVLTRENQELDPRTVWYAHSLQKKTMILSSLLDYLYKSTATSTYKKRLTALRYETSCFTLRWRPVLNPDPKVWTRSMIMPVDFAGTLEVEIPYVLIRGTRGIEEIQELVCGDYIKNHVKQDSTRRNTN